MTAAPETPSLVADAVEFRHSGGPSIGPASFALGPGVHRLAGANGSGKTTLLRCLAADLAPTSGRVRVNGRDPHAELGARSLVGLAPHPDDLPGFLTVERAWRWLAALRRCPDWDGDGIAARLGLDASLRLAEASAGQRRRAGLLASLVGDPSVLLLDEPWAAIDVEGAATVDALIEEARRSRVVLLATHGEARVTIDSTVGVTPMRVDAGADRADR